MTEQFLMMLLAALLDSLHLWPLAVVISLGRPNVSRASVRRALGAIVAVPSAHAAPAVICHVVWFVASVLLSAFARRAVKELLAIIDVLVADLRLTDADRCALSHLLESVAPAPDRLRKSVGSAAQTRLRHLLRRTTAVTSPVLRARSLSLAQSALMKCRQLVVTAVDSITDFIGVRCQQ
jgi:hypothetical protein